MNLKSFIFLSLGVFLSACNNGTPIPTTTVACSAPALIQAIDAANGNPDTDILELAAGCVYELTQAHNSGQFGANGMSVITTNIVINGNGATIQRSQSAATPNFRFFLVAPSGELVLRELAFRNGFASDTSDIVAANSGGAAYNRGILHIETTVMDGNKAQCSGGAVMNSGDLRVNNSSFTNNELIEFQTACKGAVIYSTVENTSLSNPAGSSIEQSTFSRNGLLIGREALFNAYGPMFIRNSTISSNGAGIDNEDELTIQYSTVVNNQAFGVYSFQIVNLDNSIIALNGAKNCGGNYNQWAITGALMDTDGSCPSAYHVTSAQLALAPLADNGGFTETHALNEGSFAINLASGNCPPWDQRGEPRPFGAFCDLGAFESPFDPEIVAVPVFPEFTDTPTPEAQPPKEVLIAIPQQNVNCREGNSNQFEIADTLFQGERYEPTGRGPDNLWLRFSGPATGQVCWVYVENLDLSVNDKLVTIDEVSEQLLPLVNYPPLPTATSTSTVTPEPHTPMPTPEAYTPQCSDGIDNDGDRRVDMDDRECSSPNDNDEEN